MYTASSCLKLSLDTPGQQPRDINNNKTRNINNKFFVATTNTPIGLHNNNLFYWSTIKSIPKYFN